MSTEEKLSSERASAPGSDFLTFTFQFSQKQDLLWCRARMGESGPTPTGQVPEIETTELPDATLTVAGMSEAAILRTKERFAALTVAHVLGFKLEPLKAPSKIVGAEKPRLIIPE